MTKQFEFLKVINPKSFSLSSLIGASLPLSFILFIIATKEDSLEAWMFIPLTIIPIGGAFGGIFFYLMGFLWFPTGKQKLIAIIFSTLVYFVAIWLSAVMAFNLTGDWD